MEYTIKTQTRIWVLFICIICIPYYGFSAPSSKSISLVDGAGRTIVIKSPPQRIVVVGPAYFICLHMLYMFPEIKRLLVGYEKRGRSKERFLPLIDPDYSTKTMLAVNPGSEQIAALNPDLVVTKGSVAGHLSRSLAVLNIPVLYLDIETPERFLKNIEILGKVLGNEKRSAEIRAFYNQRLNRIKQTLAEISPNKKPNVLVMEYSNRGGTVAVRVPAKTWIQTMQVKKAGGNPVWIDDLKGRYGWQIVGFEQIARWNPDKVFMIIWFQLNGPQVIKKLQSDKKWRLLKAMSSNEFYQFPQDIYGWDTPDPRWILGLLWMARQTYPKSFGNTDMKQEVYQFFIQLFGIDKSVVEKNIMPLVIINENK